MIVLFDQTVAEIAEVGLKIGGEKRDGDTIATAASGVELHALEGGGEILDLGEALDEVVHSHLIISATCHLRYFQFEKA